MIKPIPQEAYFGVITPSSSLETPEKIRNGLAYLAELGYHSKIGNFVYGSSNHFSGTPKERASDIMIFFKNPDIAAIIASCGGYGAQSVLPYLDFNIIRQNPKPIIGFSDITALQTAVYTLSGISSIAGIMLKFDFSDNNPAFQTKNSFEKLIIDGQFTPVPAGNILNSGYAEGVLIGTNFCTLMSLAGTTYFPRLEQKILLLEDIDEKSYRIERLLCQLEQQQGFELVSAIIFGTFSNCALNHPEEKDIESVLDEFAARHPKITMVKHFPFGHTKARICLPIGEKMQLDATSSVPVLQIAHQMK
ncbi:MAG: LD-carboxypeptidase [Azospirillum sp.]|nr:LD-carboxypeptidase [Azospirillum sp.]